MKLFRIEEIDKDMNTLSISVAVDKIGSCFFAGNNFKKISLAVLNTRFGYL